jgi:hypothetical protein
MAYAFDPTVLHQVARKAQQLPFDEMTRVVVGELEGLYPRHVDGSNDYIFNLTSGFCGMMKVLHASISEYLIIFGSSVGTEAFSGRYQMEIHDFVMSGEMWTYTEDRCGERQITRVGERALLPAAASRAGGSSRGPGCWSMAGGSCPRRCRSCWATCC